MTFPPPMSKLATASFIAAALAIIAVVLAILFRSPLPLEPARTFGYAGIVLALVSFAVLHGRPFRGKLRAFRSLVLSSTAIVLSLLVAARLERVERARDAEAAEGLLLRVEKKIEEARTVTVRSRCDSYPHTLYATVLIEKPNKVRVRLKRLARDGTAFSKTLVCDGDTLRYVQDGVPPWQGKAPANVAAWVRRSLLRLWMEDGAFLGRELKPFDAPVEAEAEFDFTREPARAFPASGFRFERRPERAYHPDNGTVRYEVRVGPERRREVVDISGQTGLPFSRHGGCSMIFDTFALDEEIDPGQFELQRP